MGWSSGSQLAEKLWDEIRKYIPAKDHKKLARKIYSEFCEDDADDWGHDSNLLIDCDFVEAKE